ncbi:MAG TPA: alkaline phosphatase family protein, partial [Candidatus Polarisedimenticolia bacterium]|nr:alkaline phosphatase family protein [Candidatus Polarisedimenticolia bacterium]
MTLGPPGSSEESGRADLDRIRRQLRERGYLRGPLTGWMVGPSGARLSPLRVNAASSLRVGLLGGPLVGLPAAAAVAAANRPHIGSARDLILLGIYFSAAMGLTLAVLEFLTDTLLGWLARRGLTMVGRAERLAGRVGLLFGAAATLYLAALLRGGRAAAGGSGLPAWLIWGAAVVGALAIGHLIGRLTRLGSLVSLAAAGGGQALSGRASDRRGRLVAAGGVLLLLAAAALMVFLPVTRGAVPRPPARFDALPFPGRILLVGVDGLDSALLESARSDPALPHIARLSREGALYELSGGGPNIPPSVWTSIATGRPAAEHGVLGYQSDRLPGMRAPMQQTPGASPLMLSLRLLLPPLSPSPAAVSSGMRRSRAIWEVLADAGVPTAAVNWWATWPAGSGEGVGVSERAFARLAARARPDRDAAPEALQRELEGLFGADLKEARRRTGRTGADPESPAGPAALIDAWHALIFERLASGGVARVLLVYLPGLDIARTRSPAGEGRDDLLRGLDALLGRLSEAMSPSDLLLVVGDPGRSGDSAGVLLAYGGRVRRSPAGRRADRLDIAPTLLALAGLPPARDLPGRALL